MLLPLHYTVCVIVICLYILVYRRKRRQSYTLNHYYLEPTSLSSSCTLEMVKLVKMESQKSKIDIDTKNPDPTANCFVNWSYLDDTGYESMNRFMEDQRDLEPSQGGLSQCSSVDANGYETIEILDGPSEVVVNPTATEMPSLNHATGNLYTLEPAASASHNRDDQNDAMEGASKGEIVDEDKAYIESDKDLEAIYSKVVKVHGSEHDKSLHSNDPPDTEDTAG